MLGQTVLVMSLEQSVDMGAAAKAAVAAKPNSDAVDATAGSGLSNTLTTILPAKLALSAGQYISFSFSLAFDGITPERRGSGGKMLGCKVRLAFKFKSFLSSYIPSFLPSFLPSLFASFYPPP